jgi:hypothetical protein
MASTGAIGFIGLFLTMGWLLMYAGVNRYRQRNLMADTPTSTVRSLAMGRVELKGDVEPVGETFRAPFTDDDVVLYRYAIEKYYKDNDGHEHWQTAESGVEMRAFYLNDGTGRVLVDPEGASLDVRTNVYEVDEGEADPQAVQQFLDGRAARFDEHRTDGLAAMGQAQFDVVADGMRVGDATEIIEAGRRRRYVEEYLPVGEDVYVFGQASERPGASGQTNAENAVVGDGDDVPSFTISHRSEEEVVDRSLKLVASVVAFGVVFALFGFAALVLAAGPILGVVLTAATLGLAYLGKDYVSKVRFSSPAS